MPTIGDIFRGAFPGYASTHRLRPAAHRAAGAIMACRTPVLGGHAEVCPEGHYVRSHYNSCKHRACPQCRGLEMERWLQQQVARYALACDYRHVVFTTPRQLIPLWRYNRSRFSALLFEAAKETLLGLMQDATCVGALPGIVATLHTWGRSGIEHLHLHFLVTDGGWKDSGWKAASGRFFVPYEALRHGFRDRLLTLLEKALRRGDLVVPADTDATAMAALLTELGTLEWHVKVMERYPGGEGVLTYFSRYVRGGPISNPQITRFDGERVEYRYYQHETGACTSGDLPVDEFIRRILEHVPEKGFRTVRYYGLFAPSRRTELAACRQALGMAPYHRPERLTLEAYLARFEVTPLTVCPVCGRPLHREQLRPVRAHDPPATEESYARAA